MHITIAGGTGFVGRFMIPRYLQAGHTVTVIGRSTRKIKQLFNDSVQPLDWDTFNNTGNPKQRRRICWHRRMHTTKMTEQPFIPYTMTYDLTLNITQCTEPTQ